MSSRDLVQPRDVTNFTVGGFAPMSPRISSPMHHGGGGGRNQTCCSVWASQRRR